MELSILVPSEELLDEAVRPNEFVSMQFSTPTSITIRRPNRSLVVDRVSKKKCLNFPVSLPKRLSDCEPACSDVVEISNPGFVVCPFDLGISSDLRRKNIVDVKPMLSAQEIEATTGVVIDSFPEIAQSSMTQAIDPVIKVSDQNLLIEAPPVNRVIEAMLSMAEVIEPNLLIEATTLFDDLPDIAFDLFVPSIPDCVLSGFDDGLLSDDARSDRNLAAKDARWGTASRADYEIVRKGGARKSIRVDNWALKSFNEWRAFRGYPTTESIADLSEKSDVSPLVDLLVQYFLELKTQKLGLYAPGTISGMLRSIGRLIRGRQEEQIIEVSEEPAFLFNIVKDVRYRKVVVAANQACRRSFEAGLGRETLKSDVVTFAEEEAMLASNAASLDTPSGLNCRFAWYCIKNFFIRGGVELRKLDSSEMALINDEYGDECLSAEIFLQLLK